MQYLKQGQIFLNGQPWYETNYIHDESEECWVSPKLIPREERIVQRNQVLYIFHFG